MEKGRKRIANNKKAWHDYFIEETYECGIELFGTEVKSMRQGACSLKEAFVQIRNNEVFIYGMHVSPYEKGNIFNKIAKLAGKVAQQGYTIVPLETYFDHGLVKVQIALAKGKKLYDKRDAIAKKDAKRDVERAFAERQK